MAISRPYLKHLVLSCNIFGLEPAGYSRRFDLEDPAAVKRVPESYDLASFQKYIDWISCWVEESLNEHKFKSWEKKYSEPQWCIDARGINNVCVRLMQRASMLRRTIRCRGYEEERCPNGSECHIVLDQERLNEPSAKEKYDTRQAEYAAARAKTTTFTL